MEDYAFLIESMQTNRLSEQSVGWRRKLFHLFLHTFQYVQEKNLNIAEILYSVLVAGAV